MKFSLCTSHDRVNAPQCPVSSGNSMYVSLARTSSRQDGATTAADTIGILHGPSFPMRPCPTHVTRSICDDGAATSTSKFGPDLPQWLIGAWKLTRGGAPIPMPKCVYEPQAKATTYCKPRSFMAQQSCRRLFPSFPQESVSTILTPFFRQDVESVAGLCSGIPTINMLTAVVVASAGDAPWFQKEHKPCKCPPT